MKIMIQKKIKNEKKIKKILIIRYMIKNIIMIYTVNFI